MVTSRQPAAGPLGMQGRWCPVGVTVASALRPGDTGPGGTAGAEPQQRGGVRWKGIIGLPGFLGRHKTFPLGFSYDPKPARSPSWDSAALEPEVGRKTSAGPGSNEGDAERLPLQGSRLG